MNEITASSYKVKYFFKIILRSIGFSILSSIFIGIINNFIKIDLVLNIINLLLTVYGIKFIYLDGLKKINSKFSLNETEHFNLSQNISSFLIVLAIFSFIFSLFFNSLGIILEYVIGLIFNSILSAIDTTAFMNIKTIIIAVINVLSNIFYSILIVSVVKQNFDNIYNNRRLEFTPKIITFLVIYLILSIIPWFIRPSTNSSNAISEVRNQEVQSIEESSNTSNSSNDAKEDKNTISSEKFLELVSTTSDSFGIFSDENFYHAGFFSNSIYAFENLNYENGKKVFEEDSSTDIFDSIHNIEFMYSNDEKVYYYHPKKTDTSGTGLYSLNLKTNKIKQLTKETEMISYNLANKTVDYFDYIVKNRNEYSIKKFLYDSEETSTIFSFEVPTDGLYEIELYADNYITHISDKVSYSVFYKNDQELCRIDAPIDYFIVAKGCLHIFVANSVYSVNLETSEVVNVLETPFQTADYTVKFTYDPDLTDINRLVYFGTTLYEFDSENYTFNTIEHSPEYLSSLDNNIINLNDKYLIAYGTLDIPTIVEKNTWKIIKEYPGSEVSSFKVGKNGEIYLISRDGIISRLTDEIIENE